MIGNGFLLHVEKLVRILNDKLPEYSRISCDFKEINNVGINQVDLYGKYRLSKYIISIWVGDSEYFEYKNLNNSFKFDVRVESDDGKDRFCEYEFNHNQNFEESIDKAIKWIEKELENNKK